MGAVMFLVMLGVVAALAAGLVLALRTILPHMSRRRRLISASLVAAGLPTAIPLAAILIDSGGDSHVWIAVIALLVGVVFMAAIAAFPAALLMDRRLAKAATSDNPPIA